MVVQRPDLFRAVACAVPLLDRGCGFNVAEASRRSGIDRVHVFRLIKKHGLRR